MPDIAILATNTTLKTDCNTKICETEIKLLLNIIRKYLKHNRQQMIIIMIIIINEIKNNRHQFCTNFC